MVAGELWWRQRRRPAFRDTFVRRGCAQEAHRAATCQAVS